MAIYDMEPYSSDLLKIKWIKENIGKKVGFQEQAFEFNPIIGWSLIKKEHSYVQKNGSSFKLNKYGRRITGEQSDFDLPEILILGDSFAFGEEVNDKHSVPFLLNKKITDYNVINLAVPAYGHGQMLLGLKNYKKIKMTKYTVLIFLEMNMYRNAMTFRDFGKPSFHRIGGKLHINNSEVRSPEEIVRSGPYSISMAIFSLFQNYFDPKFSDMGLVHSTHEIMREMKKKSDQLGAQFLVVFAPQLYLDHKEKKIDKRKYLELGTEEDKIESLKTLLAEDSILHHDIRKEIFQNYLNGSDYYTSKNGEHWSMNANEDIAIAVERKIMELIKEKNSLAAKCNKTI